MSERRGFRYIHSKEFRYFGKMYDIVSQKDLGDSIKFICVNDTKEEALISAFMNHTKPDSKNIPEKRNQKISILDNYLAADFFNLKITPAAKSSVIFTEDYSFTYFNSIFHPPWC